MNEFYLLKFKFFFLFQVFFFYFLNLSLATEKELDLAYSFYYEKYYYRSISEIYRLKFYHQIKNPAVDNLLAKNCYFLKDFFCLENLGQIYLKKPSSKKKMAEKISILSLVSLAYLRQDKSEKAKIYWAASQEEKWDFVSEKDLLKTQKAFWLSLFPGAGFIYTGNYGTAITAFLLNAAFSYLMLNALENGQTASFTLFFFFEYNFYLGNMRGSREKAKKYNQNLIREQRDAFILRYEKKLLP